MSFDHLKSIYRDFDIRGKFPEEISPDEVYKIGKAITQRYGLKKVAIGYDVRPSAEEMYQAISKGILEMGADVINLGLCTTPMSYFMCGSTDVDATVMITASHMPSDYNGLKITVEDAKPLTRDMIQEIRTIVGTHTFSSESTHGCVTTHALQDDWIQSFKARHNLGNAKFTLVVDPANMIGILEIDTFKAFSENLTVHTIYDTFDHSCPNHEANPVKHETLKDLGCEVVARRADIGIAFDGDADRVGFVDEKGRPVASDIIGILLARYILKQNPGAGVVYDLRSTRALQEEILRSGGVPYVSKVGHSNIKPIMREHDAVLGVELSGHFFFKESYYAEGGAVPAFYILELMHMEGKTLSELVKEVTTYAQSGEINSTITQTIDEIYTRLIARFPEASMTRLDGLSLTTDAWWCNVRPSANDPVMRLNVEALDQPTMEKIRDEMLTIIRAT